MRDYTSANAKRAKQAQPQKCLEGTLSFKRTGGAGPGLIVCDATLRGGALSGLLVDCDAAAPPVDVVCTCGITLSEDRLSLRHGPSGLVGRVFESGHTAGEPDLRQAFVGADDAPGVANRAGRGDAATVGDVAAGEGRGVARGAV
jgi:hypothetical protein